MPDKHILVELDNSVSNRQAMITKEKHVVWFPADSEHSVTVTFDDKVPFSDWGGLKSMTGDRGKPLKGKVDKNAISNYPYKYSPVSLPISLDSSRPLTNPGAHRRGRQRAFDSPE